MAKKKNRWANLPLVLVELAGFGVAFYLFLISVRVLFPDNVPCPRGSLFACHSLLRGKFSHLGPFSIAALGMLYFVIQLGLTALVRPGGRLLQAKGICVLGGLAFVGYLRSIEIVWLHKICPWCYGAALATILEAFFLFPLLVPPLPRLRPWPRLGVMFGVFAGLIVLGVPVAYFAGSAESALALHVFATPKTGDDSGDETDPTPATQPTEPVQPRAKPTPKPEPAPRPTPSPEPRPPAPASLPQPKAGPTQAASPVQEKPLDLQESKLDNEETKLLRSKGWRIVANTQAVQKAVGERPPVLLMVFDPFCEECEFVIKNQVTQPIVAAAGVTRLGIEQAELTGPMSAQVKAVPTFLLIDAEGKLRWTHTGRIEPTDLVRAVEQALR